MAKKDDDLKHGKDTTGAAAPDQGDQALINDKRKKDEATGDAELSERHPPQAQGGMAKVEPYDKEEAERLGKLLDSDRKEASKNTDSIPKTSQEESKK